MKKKSVVLLAILMLLAMVCLSACGGGEQAAAPPASGGQSSGDAPAEPIVVSYCDTDTEARSTIQCGFWLQQKWEEEYDGALVLDVYANNTLGDDEEVLKGLLLGTCNVYSGMGVVGNVVGTKGALVDMPFVYSSYEDWYNGNYNLGGVEMYDSVLDGTGYYCYDLMYAGAKHLTSNSQNFATLDELKGFKIRCTNNEMNMLLWNTLGANPTPVAWGELYTALQQHTVDGMEHSLGIIVDQRFYEPNPYITLTAHTYCPYVCVASEDWYDNLDPAWQGIILEGLKEMTMKQHELELDDEANKWMATLEEAGTSITSLPDEVRAEMQELSKVVYEFMYESCGQEVVDAYVATGGQV